MKKAVFTSLAFVLFASASAQKFTDAERTLTSSGSKQSLMRVLQVTDASDLKVLKAPSTDVSLKDESLPLLMTGCLLR